MGRPFDVDDGSDRTDRLAVFWPLIPGIRWGTFAVGVVVASLRTGLGGHVPATMGVLAAYASWRVFRPLRYHDGDLSSLLLLLGDLGIHALAVAATGYWQSPFVFCLLTPVVAAGFARGFAFAVRVAVACVLAISLPLVFTYGNHGGLSLQDAVQWAVELVLVAMVAGYARHLFGMVSERHSLEVDRLSQANALLSSLHRIARTLPASLDLDEVLTSTSSRLHDLFAFDVAVILLRDDASGGWTVGRAEGVRLETTLDDDALPPAVHTAAGRDRTVLIENLLEQQATGIGLMTSTGLYGPLRARGTLVGVIVLEHHAVGAFGPREADLLDSFVDAAALAIDNARWFGRLRTVGADEERTRIARELHDRVGQSLAYLAFELDRILKHSHKELVHEELQRLRQDVRGVVTEMRETLYDLRIDVSDQRDMVATLQSMLDRVSERGQLEVSFRHDGAGRLPLPQERELWRIAQEAIANVERHAHASHVSVVWQCDGHGASLVVADDGRGFPVWRGARMGSYGIIGMRERADAIGARLEIESTPGHGTTVRCSVGR